MVQGLRVVFNPDPLSGGYRSNGIPEAGARGTVTAGRTASGLRTYLGGPGGLVFVQWDGDRLVSAVSMWDLRLELPEDAAAR